MAALTCDICGGKLVGKADGTICPTRVSDWFGFNEIISRKLFNQLETYQADRADAVMRRAEQDRLDAERRAVLENEKASENLKGLFSGKRRKEIEARLEQIEIDLRNL